MISTYLALGLTLGLVRLLWHSAEYLIGWYRYRHVLDFGATVEEAIWGYVWLLVVAVLLMPFWPLWIYFKIREYSGRPL